MKPFKKKLIQIPGRVHPRCVGWNMRLKRGARGVLGHWFQPSGTNHQQLWQGVQCYCLLGEHMDVSENSGFSPQIIHFNRVFHYQPSILGYPYFWKHPYPVVGSCFFSIQFPKSISWLMEKGPNSLQTSKDSHRKPSSRSKYSQA